MVTLQERNSIICEEFRNPWDIVELAGHLYVSEQSLKSIHNYDPATKSYSCWSINHASATLSVTPKGNILFTLKSANTVVEYTPTGLLVKEIYLGGSDITPIPCHSN